MENPITFTFVMAGMFVFYGWIAWIVLEWRKTTRKANLHKSLIERFTSPADLQSFLTSETGDRLFKSLSLGGGSPREKVLASFSRGTIVSFLGIASLVVSFVLTEQASLFLAGGIIVLALGAGLIVAGVLSHRLGLKWGMFDR